MIFYLVRPNCTRPVTAILLINDLHNFDTWVAVLQMKSEKASDSDKWSRVSTEMRECWGGEFNFLVSRQKAPGQHVNAGLLDFCGLLGATRRGRRRRRGRGGGPRGVGCLSNVAKWGGWWSEQFVEEEGVQLVESGNGVFEDWAAVEVLPTSENAFPSNRAQQSAITSKRRNALEVH